jgi:anaerobic selenocysteine-containing dehydrogenase
MNVFIEGDRVSRVEGLPEDPRTRGRLCPKGRASLDVLYSPDRILQPLRRKGARGDGEWEAISWSEALDQIKTRFKEIVASDGARAISIYRGQAADWGASWLYALRFMNALGSPNVITPSHLCYVPRTTAHLLTYGGMAEPDYENTRCIIVWGANPAQTNERSPFGWQMEEARARGARLIVVDPIRTRLAESADIWLQVRPGTDCALILGMLRVIVDESAYDPDFVRDWTVGFDALKHHLQEYDIQKVAEITGVPGQTISEAARLYATTRPAAIFEGNGLDQHINVVQTMRAMCILRAITGNIEVKGGETFPDTLSRYTRDIRLLERLPADAVPAGGRGYWFELTRQVPPSPVLDAILTGEPYPIKAMLVQGGNPVVTWANTPKTDKALRQLDFLAVMDTFMSRTATLADLVLPAATFFESTNFNAYPGMRTNSPLLQQKVIEPIGQSWPDWKLWFEIAKLLGFENEFPWNDVEEAIDYQLEPTGFRAEHLKGRIVVIPKRYEKFRQNGFFTPSKKVELYSSAMAEHGYDALPRHLDPSEYFPDYDTVREEYPLLGTNYPRSVFYVHSQLRQIPALRKADPEPLVYLHPTDAEKREIPEGARVRVRSPLGQVEMKSTITERLPPGMLALAWGWGESVPEAGTNELIDDTPRDPMTGTTTNRLFFCEVQKA